MLLYTFTCLELFMVMIFAKYVITCKLLWGGEYAYPIFWNGIKFAGKCMEYRFYVISRQYVFSISILVKAVYYALFNYDRVLWVTHDPLLFTFIVLAYSFHSYL